MYSLKKFKHLDNNYLLVELDDKVKNNFLSSFLIGIDNKFLKLNATDLNESTNYYKDKLNDKVMEKFDGKKFNKLNKNHLAYLADLCKMNLVIFDLNKLNLKFSTDLDKCKEGFMVVITIIFITSISFLITYLSLLI